MLEDFASRHNKIVDHEGQVVRLEAEKEELRQRMAALKAEKDNKDGLLGQVEAEKAEYKARAEALEFERLELLRQVKDKEFEIQEQKEKLEEQRPMQYLVGDDVFQDPEGSCFTFFDPSLTRAIEGQEIKGHQIEIDFIVKALN